MAEYKTQFGENPPTGSGAGAGEAPNKDGNFTFPKTDDVGTNTGESFNAEFTFYQPSGSSYKYWTMVGANGHANDYSGFYCVGSQIKTTSAVNAIQMKFQATNIASGIFTLYGVNN